MSHTMTPDRFRKAADALTDTQLDEIISALRRARNTAMEQTVRARIPECGNFGAIAQDLDFLMDEILQAAPEDDQDAPKTRAIQEIAQEQGLPLVDIPLADVDAADLRGTPKLD